MAEPVDCWDRGAAVRLALRVDGGRERAGWTVELLNEM